MLFSVSSWRSQPVYNPHLLRVLVQCIVACPLYWHISLASQRGETLLRMPPTSVGGADSTDRVPATLLLMVPARCQFVSHSPKSPMTPRTFSGLLSRLSV